MTRRDREGVTSRVEGRAWTVGLLAWAVALLPLTAARAQAPFAAGTKVLGLGGALSISHDTRSDIDLDTLTGFELLPHLGYVLTDSTGPAWLRGNLQVLAEPTLVHLRDDTSSSTVVGASGLARWIFSGTRRLRPYVEVGVGALFGETALYQTDCEVNFLLQAGPGLLVSLTDRTMLTVGYRFQHISNGGACSDNVGINSSALYLGVGYLFP
ncbi:MAG TPA: acyloxyacyl hydrolase [Methylomirabilota bacterium]|nr:acyloxyacyl hydrolase [Methylomirabilota bacterium]